MESKALAPVTATLTKVLHGYHDLEILETMRFVDSTHAAEYLNIMLGKRIRAYGGTDYTVTAVTF